MKDSTILGIVAIIAILVLDGIALSQGINGDVMLFAFTCIGGISGYGVKGAKDVIIKKKG